MQILHTEASQGWGGQEIRILREAEGMRKRGHEVIFAVHPKAKLAEFASKAGFKVFLIPFKMSKFITCLLHLFLIIKKCNIHLVNTHSSTDAWIGGAAARCAGCVAIRTRHLSTPIKKGLNSRVLYNWLADGVVTTCQEVVEVIRKQAHLTPERCQSIPTGVNPDCINIDQQEVEQFRLSHGLNPADILVGTLCVLRSWKGISDLLKTAALLKHQPSIKWMIIGSGPGDDHYRKEALQLGLENVIFTGYVDPPFNALAALDIFLLLSTANEGVSQASLQAAYLRKPLITTATGGLKEVSIPGRTGFVVDNHAHQAVADHVLTLAKDHEMRLRLGENAHQLVMDQFTLDNTITSMEKFYLPFLLKQ